MSGIFCCQSIKPYRPQRLDHEAKFELFIAWANSDLSTSVTNFDKTNVTPDSPPFAVQLVRQVNFGPLESKRYFVPTAGPQDHFVEIKETDLIQKNFQKMNTFKNFKCDDHNKFFEINLYQKDPVNKHHWRADLARPASEIDL